MTEKKSTSQLAREEQANRAFAKSQAHDKLGAKVISAETKRMALDAAKTAKLRELREARENQREASVPASIPPTPEAKPKARVLRPGVRLRRS
jgi:hypothetical protein